MIQASETPSYCISSSCVLSNKCLFCYSSTYVNNQDKKQIFKCPCSKSQRFLSFFFVYIKLIWVHVKLMNEYCVILIAAAVAHSHMLYVTLQPAAFIACGYLLLLLNPHAVRPVDSPKRHSDIWSGGLFCVQRTSQQGGLHGNRPGHGQEPQ